MICVVIRWYVFRFVDISSYLFIFVLFVFLDIYCYLLIFVVMCFVHVFFVCLSVLSVYIYYCLLLWMQVSKSIPRSIPKVYPEVYQKFCWSAHYAFVRFVCIMICQYFLLFVCSRCLLLLLGGVILVWYLLLLVGIRKYSKTFVHFVLFSVGICWYMLIFVVICCYLFVFVDICSYGICWYL